MRFKREQPPVDVMQLLQLEPGASAVHVVRLRTMQPVR